MNSIDLFVGAGGLALGTASAGFCHVAVTDWNPNAIETLRFNKDHGHLATNWEIIPGDVRECEFAQFHDTVDYVFAGPPCQPFSLGGKHGAHEDERDMFPEVARAIRTIQPKAFIVENVKGILRPSFANYYRYVLLQLMLPEITRSSNESWEQHRSRLERLHTSDKPAGVTYQVVDRVLNAADFGVPQRRERVFIVGIRRDLGLEFSFPDPTHHEDALLYDQWVTSAYWEEHRVAKRARPNDPSRHSRRVEKLRSSVPSPKQTRWRTVRDALHGLPQIAEGQTSQLIANHFFNPGARAYPGHDGSPLDYPAKTLRVVQVN